jgi:hypothetical protein
MQTFSASAVRRVVSFTIPGRAQMRAVATGIAVWGILATLWATSVPDLRQDGARDVRPLTGTFHHVQGIDVEGDTVWVSSVDRAARKGYVYRVDLPSGRIAAQVEVQEGDRIHPGGIALDGDDIWVPVAEYRRNGTSAIQRRSKRTLALVSSFEANDHIGCVAAGRASIAGGNWDSVDVYFWDRTGRLVRRLENRAKTRYQDIKWIGNSLVASGILPGRTESVGAVDWLDPQTLSLQKRLTAGSTDRGKLLTNEGMTLRGGKLYFLPEDDPSRLFVFDVRP